ncbi:8-oxo-dGTP diphosphatase [Planktotalea frisia]|jgi:8-oxo-dGTP diphosphatase|uniref:NUDIX domain protein n=1 Tax=Planktotalea frisia TaxID=696762 RepID=A0A1L9NWV7_9RHOB|nr:NUDIX hydrolase [Planktotalea frisia]OJI93644.1 NUDIX domain protein [Planktotalea frisia]PZX29866.1 8-oxo-dGTP diphosphatase [Planktotalea frisia]
MIHQRAFGGAKILLHCQGALLTYLRDEKPDIPFRALWDLPGGGGEADETPLECALRETKEEFALAIPQERIEWSRAYPNTAEQALPNWFFAAPITSDEITRIKFGDEGQYWQMMPIKSYLTHTKAIPHLQCRVRDVLA